jgi:hypothetical protein
MSRGGIGRIRVEYCTSISGGTADPPASVAQISCGPKPTPTPAPVGGIAELPEVQGAPLETGGSSGPSAVVVAGLAVAAVVAALALSGAAGYARRRRVK